MGGVAPIVVGKGYGGWCRIHRTSDSMDKCRVHPSQIGLSVIVVWVLIRARNDEFPKMLHLGESRPIYVPLNNPKYGVSHGRDAVQILKSFLRNLQIWW